MLTASTVPNFSSLRVAVVGDYIADHYLFTRPRRLSREAPVMVLSNEGEEYRPGGAGNVASNLWLATHPVQHRNRVLFAGGVFYGVGMAMLAWSPSYELALAAAALAAVGGPMTDLMILMIIQTEFPTDRIGKVFAFRLTLSRTSLGVGLVLAAPVYELLPVRVGIGAAAGLVVAVSLAALVRFLPAGRAA